MDVNAYMEIGEKNFIHTYNRFPIVLDKGEGVYLYDAAGKKYLDFASGIGVFALGYHNEEYNDALKAQIDKLIHTSNLFYNVPAIEAAQKICEKTGFDRVFFTNSGTEAIEGALKLARKYAYQKYEGKRYEIIAMNHSFHGRTMGAVSVTGNPHYQEPFKPLVDGVKFAEFNNLESVKALVSEKTCAILFEPVQGEGGIYPATQEFMEGVRQICDDNDIVMICDEIQCGMGRTGKLFAYEHYGVRPDVIASAKALGCGVPVGAFISNAKIGDAMVPGDHGTTYGGNPLVCTAVNTVFDLFDKQQILEHVNQVSLYLEEQLTRLTEEFDCVATRRGKGLMQGLVMKVPVRDVINACLEQGLIVISAGTDVLRLLPPLVITEQDVDVMLETLKKVLCNF